MPKPNWFGESIVFQIANPAAGALVEVRPAAGTLWHVLSINASFLASAAVANRFLYMADRNGVSDTGHVFYPTATVAGGNPIIAASSRWTGNPIGVAGYLQFPLNPLCYINDTNYLVINAVAMDVADQFSSIFVTCERMLDE